jgi:hypothetical protein
MKKIIFKAFSLLLILVLISSCVDESTFNNPVHFGLEKGAFAKFKDAVPTNALLPTNPNDALIEGQVIDANSNISSYKLSMKATLSSGTVDVTDFLEISSFPSTLKITPQMIADALHLPVNQVGFGDSFQFVATAIRNDGTVFSGNSPTYDETNMEVGGGNTDLTLNSASTGYHSAMNFSFVIACDAFEPSIVTGTYTVVEGSFFAFLGETSYERQVIGGPYDDGNLVLANNQIAIIGGEWPSTGADDLILTINANGVMIPEGYNADGVAIPEGTAGLIENKYLIEKAIVLPCIDKIDIDLNLNPYSANVHKFILERI